MVAEVMKVPMDGVQVVDPDTRYRLRCGHDRLPAAPSNMGTTAVRAAQDVRRKLLKMASVKLTINVDELDTAAFLVFSVRHPERRLPWIAITGSARHQQNFGKTNFALYLAEVCVNLETGEVRLIRALEGSDVDKIIDPISIRMQAEGSLGAAGGDAGLFEKMVMDKKLGRFMTGNMIGYKWRTFNNFSCFDTVLLESEWDTEAFHAVGFGEITPSPAPAAILMAVSDAIGHEITEYPCSPTVVLRAMGKIKSYDASIQLAHRTVPFSFENSITSPSQPAARYTRARPGAPAGSGAGCRPSEGPAGRD